MLKKFFIFLLVLFVLLVVVMWYVQYRYENAIGICERVGEKEEFYQKLDKAENENNTTLARILLIYYAHRCTDFTEEEKTMIDNKLFTIRHNNSTNRTSSDIEIKNKGVKIKE